MNKLLLTRGENMIYRFIVNEYSLVGIFVCKFLERRLSVFDNKNHCYETSKTKQFMLLSITALIVEYIHANLKSTCKFLV